MKIENHFAAVSQVSPSELSFSGLQDMCEGIDLQLHEDAQPIWGRRTHILPFRNVKEIPKGMWPALIQDNIHEPGAAGFHTDVNNQPRIFVQFSGETTSITLSHECLTGDTLIPLLNGTTVPIKELVGREHFGVYSCKDDGSLRPGNGHSARVMRENAEIVSVELDNGKTIRCTADHLLMLRDGSYKEAGKLVEGESLMPLYRKVAIMDSDKKRKGMYDYEHCWDNRLQKWILTHRMVVPYCSSGYVRHHKDFSRFNNDPENIQVMKWADHQKVHADHISKYRDRPRKPMSDERRKQSAINGATQLRKYNGSPKQKADHARYLADPEKVAATIKKGRETWAKSGKTKRSSDSIRNRESAKKNITKYNKSDAHREVARKVGKRAMESLFSNPEWKAAKLRQNSAVCKLRNHKKYHEDKGVFNPNCDVCTGRLTRVPAMNHKVVRVYSSGREDVYDITVDKYHNFATEAGVFVHNCIETVPDPFGNRLISVVHPTLGPIQILCEIADPPEEVSYTRKGIKVSDFIRPEWYDAKATPGMTYSFTGECKTPLSLLPGGYYSFIQKGRWKQASWFTGTKPVVRTLGKVDATKMLREWVDCETSIYKATLKTP